MEKAEEELLAYAKTLERQRFTSKEVFQYLLLEFCGTPYVWGKATTEQSDCSGTICACLNALYRTQRRVNADTLYRTCFTRTPVRYEGIQALFFLDNTGRAVHVQTALAHADLIYQRKRPFLSQISLITQIKPKTTTSTPTVFLCEIMQPAAFICEICVICERITRKRTQAICEIRSFFPCSFRSFCLLFP